MAEQSYPTALGLSTTDEIRLLGRDLSADLIGQVSFSHLAFYLITLREPTDQQVRMFDAVLVSIADHGFTPTAIAARMTYLSAPESIQGALASGLLGGGSRFLGASEDTGAFLAEALGRTSTLPTTDAEWDAVAAEAIRRRRAAGLSIPGLGHHLHKQGDPRAARLVALAHETGTYGEHLALFEAVGRVAQQEFGKPLPLNGAGACGAALADVGVPVDILRGVVLLARCAGLLGHIAEESRRPIARAMFEHIEGNAVYEP